MFKLLLVSVFSVIMTGCVTPIPLKEQSPAANYKVADKVLISVVDERTRVKKGKPKTFIGVAHGSFGIPFNWHVKHVLSTEESDQDKTLAEWLQYRIVHGLNESGWQSAPFTIDNNTSESDIADIIKENKAIKLIKLTLTEWYFSINLNWVTAFNFDTETTLEVFDSTQGKRLQKVIKERDVVEENASESPQNNILQSYKNQLDQILNDKEVIHALTQ